VFRRYVRLGALDVERQTSSPVRRRLTIAARPIVRALYRVFGH
jgi:hypothetical protein